MIYDHPPHIENNLLSWSNNRNFFCTAGREEFSRFTNQRAKPTFKPCEAKRKGKVSSVMIWTRRESHIRWNYATRTVRCGRRGEGMYVWIHEMMKIMAMKWLFFPKGRGTSRPDDDDDDRFAYLCWSMYCAAWICFGVPVMVMMRSVEPGSASSIWMKAFDSERMRRMRPPPLPMMAPASCKEIPSGSNFQ